MENYQAQEKTGFNPTKQKFFQNQTHPPLLHPTMLVDNNRYDGMHCDVHFTESVQDMILQKINLFCEEHPASGRALKKTLAKNMLLHGSDLEVYLNQYSCHTRACKALNVMAEKIYGFIRNSAPVRNRLGEWIETLLAHNSNVQELFWSPNATPDRHEEFKEKMKAFSDFLVEAEEELTIKHYWAVHYAVRHAVYHMLEGPLVSNQSQSMESQHHKLKKDLSWLAGNQYERMQSSFRTQMQKTLQLFEQETEALAELTGLIPHDDWLVLHPEFEDQDNSQHEDDVNSQNTMQDF